MAGEKKSGKLKWLVIGVALVGAIGGGAWYWQSKRDGDTEYQTAPVARGDLIQLVTATGQLNPVTNVQVGSQISGMIQKLSADFNSQVKAGELIAQLDPSSYLANLHLDEGDLANANAG